jgi:hypothetical protein
MTKRTLSVLSVAALIAAMVVVAALPASAASSANHIVYFPFGKGATYSCFGGPPFVSNGSDNSPGNCAIERIGAPPVGLVCDIPTTITFVHEMHQATLDARLCHQHP